MKRRGGNQYVRSYRCMNSSAAGLIQKHKYTFNAELMRYAKRSCTRQRIHACAAQSVKEANTGVRTIIGEIQSARKNGGYLGGVRSKRFTRSTTVA